MNVKPMSRSRQARAHSRGISYSLGMRDAPSAIHDLAGQRHRWLVTRAELAAARAPAPLRRAMWAAVLAHLPALGGDVWALRCLLARCPAWLAARGHRA